MSIIFIMFLFFVRSGMSEGMVEQIPETQRVLESWREQML